MKNKTRYYLVGNAHLDPVWLWDWREGHQENQATLYSALNRLDEFDDFVFTCSSAQFYAWIEDSNPELFERIRHHVETGRWVIVGGWWIQPDCNVPSGEGLTECLCSHAEENSIVQAAYHGIAVAGATIYTTFSPCLLCSKMIINAGIKEVVYKQRYSIDSTSMRLLAEAGVKVRALED